VGVAVVTRGEQGPVARTGDTTLRAGTFPVDIVDASGSGDDFDVGFIVGMLEGWDLLRTLSFASAIPAS
jgi:5-dehydro-2-deoxygluconokinase